jgi:hypothetical protein
MKVRFGRPHAEPASNGAFELLTSLYRAAYAKYQRLTDKNTALNLTGRKPSQQARLDEECALEQLDVARHALLSATALACPTVH